MSTDTGLVGPHAYTVLGPVELSNGQRLVKLRNPWGYEKYSGPWSDTDDTNWTDALRAEVAQDRTLDDGIFFMPLDLYMEAFRSLDVNLNNEDWHYDYFLSVDEPVTGNATSGYCGSQCTEVELYVYSPNAAQDVYLTLHTTMDRAVSPICQDPSTGPLSMKIGNSTLYAY